MGAATGVEVVPAHTYARLRFDDAADQAARDAWLRSVLSRDSQRDFIANLLSLAALSSLDETRERGYELFAEDLSAFNYTFDGWGRSPLVVILDPVLQAPWARTSSTAKQRQENAPAA